MQSDDSLPAAADRAAIYSTFRLDNFKPLDRHQLRSYNATISSRSCKHPGHPEACLHNNGEDSGNVRPKRELRSNHLRTSNEEKRGSNNARRQLRPYGSTNLRLIQAVSQKNVVDPFDAFCVPMSNQVLAMLQYTIYELIQSNFRAELLVTGQDVEQHRRYVFAEQRVRGSITSGTCELNPLLAGASARISGSSRNFTPITKLAPYYLHQAIQTLRTEMKDIKAGSQIPHATFSSIHNIFCSAWYLGDLKAAQIHLQLMKNLLACHVITPNFVTKSIKDPEEHQRQVDVQVAAEADSYPLWRGTDWQPTPISQQRLDRIRLEVSQLATYMIDTDCETQIDKTFMRKLQLGNPFNHLSFHSSQREDFRHSLVWTRRAILPLLMSFEYHYAGVLETHLIPLRFQEIISCDFEPWHRMLMWCIGVQHGSVEDGIWIGNTCIAICHKLLSLPRPNQYSSQSQDHLADSFRLALLVVLQQLDGGNPWRVPGIIVSRLRKAITRTEIAACLDLNIPAPENIQDIYERFSSIEARLLLWMLQVGLTFTSIEEEYNWFDSRITLLRKSSAHDP